MSERIKVFTCFYVRHAFENTVIVIETLFGNIPTVYGVTNGAARIAAMFAVAEFTVANEGAEFDKALRDLLRGQVPQTEFTYSRGVNDVAAMLEVVETGRRGGVLAQT